MVAVPVIAFGIEVPRVGDLASIPGGLPAFHVPMVPLTLETRQIILPYAVILAAIGLIESLLTLNLVGEITGKRGGARQECMAQGVANTVTGFFGGCAMIGQGMINVKSGVAAALFVLAFILVAAPLIELIPLAALVGVMFMVVIGTLAWNSLRFLARVPLSDAFVIVLVTVVIVLEDLAVALVVGVIVSALTYAWNNARRIHARNYTTPAGAKVYQAQGPLFFGSSDGFVELLDVPGDPSTMIVDLADSRVVDQSAVQAIEAVAGKDEAEGKTLRLRHLSRDCHRLLKKAGHLMVDSDDDPDYQLAVDYHVRTGILGGHKGRPSYRLVGQTRDTKAMTPITRRARRTVYENRWLRVHEDAVRFADGSDGIYGVVEKSDYALIVPRHDDGRLQMVRPYRYPVGGAFWEFPQGAWDAGYGGDPAALARAELAEETGLRAASLRRLGRLHEAYGFAGHACHVFLATGLSEGTRALDPGEHGMPTQAFAMHEIRGMIADGAITDAPTVAALTLLALADDGQDRPGRP